MKCAYSTHSDPTDQHRVAPIAAASTLVWIVSQLGTAALVSIVRMSGITPTWSGTTRARSVTVSHCDLDLSRPAGACALAANPGGRPAAGTGLMVAGEKPSP